MDDDNVKLPETPSTDGNSDDSWTLLDEVEHFEEGEIVEEEDRIDSTAKQDDSELSSNDAVILNEAVLDAVDGQQNEK